MPTQPARLYQGDPLIRKKLIFKQVSLWLCFSVQKCRVCGMRSSFLNRLLCGCVFQSTKCRVCGMNSSFLNRLLCGCVFQSTKCRVCGMKSSLCGWCDWGYGRRARLGGEACTCDEKEKDFTQPFSQTGVTFHQGVHSTNKNK